MKYLIILLFPFSIANCAFDVLNIAEVIVLKKLDKLPSKIRDKAYVYKDDIIEASLEIGVSPDLIIAVAWTESHFKESARSHKGAQGIMQLMPKTRKWIEKKSGYTNDFKAGAWYLKYLMKKFKGNKKRAIIAYNEGPVRVMRKIRKGKFWKNHDYHNKVSRRLASINS